MEGHSHQAIAIGGSWGGMDAIINILKDVPQNFPLSIIVVLHRHKSLDSNLIGIFKKHLFLKIKEIDEKEFILPGVVYVAPRNYHVLIESNKSFSLDASEDVHFSRPSIDVMFGSAAEAFGKNLIGILLTGANSDGSDGLKTISELGGLTVVQDPADAESKYMPLSALRKIKPDFILNQREINNFLLNLTSNYTKDQ